MDDPYTEIAQRLHRACPAEYSRAWIVAEVGDDWDEQEIWCATGTEQKQPKIDTADSFAVGRYLRKIREGMTLPGAEPWSKCTFTLFPDGQFKFDVEYDD